MVSLYRLKADPLYRLKADPLCLSRTLQLACPILPLTWQSFIYPNLKEFKA